MDWAVWDQRHDQVAGECSYMGECQWQSDFYFGFGRDVIEENALNEKCCIQVLRVLISKANTEILELEEDLITLQSQLAWADESWSEICSSALSEKIDGLTVSMRSLENTDVPNEDDFGISLQLPREPAEKIHVVLKPLLDNYFHREDEQCTNSTVKASGQNPSTTAAGLTKWEQTLSKLGSPGSRKLEVIKDAFYPADNFMTHKSSLKAPENRQNHQHPNEQPVNTVVIPKEYLSLEYGKKDIAEKGKHECTIIEDFRSGGLGRATDESSMEKDSSTLGLIINRNDGRKRHNSASKERSLVLSLPFNTAGKGRILQRTIKDAGASSSDASKPSNSPKRKNKSSKNDAKVNRCRDIKECRSTDQSIMLEPSLQHEGRKPSISETLADDTVEMRSGALHEVTEESNVNPRHREGPDSAPAIGIDPPLSSLKTEKNSTKIPWSVKDPYVGLTDPEQKAADSLLLLQNHKGGHRPTQHRKEGKKGTANLAADGDVSNSNFPMKPRKPRAKGEHKQKQKDKSGLGVVKKRTVAPDVNSDSASQSQKKTKIQRSARVDVTKVLKSLQLGLEKVHADSAGSTTAEGLSITKCSSTGDPPSNETPKLLPSPTHPSPLQDLKHLTVPELSLVAKQLNMKGYSKFRKAQLVEELGLKLKVRGGCVHNSNPPGPFVSNQIIANNPV